MAEAIRRSIMETTHEEANIADALRASVLSHDEEIARDMQLKYNLDLERAQSSDITTQSNTPLDNAAWLPPQSASPWGGAAAVKAEGPWLVARSRERFQPVKPQLAVSLPVPSSTTEPVVVSRTIVQSDVVPPLPSLSSAAGRPTTTPSDNNIACAPGSPVTPSRLVVQKKPRVVLDGMNVGCALMGGGAHRFRSRAIYLALEYYRARGVYAVALLPQNKVDTTLGYSVLADDVALLTRLHAQKRVFFTPAGASDDNFILSYAMKIQADLVSNDRFRHELGRQRGTEASKRLKKFLRNHLVPFTFILEEFTPNPNPESLADHVHHPRDRGYR